MKRVALVIGALGAMTLLSACGGGYAYRQAGYSERDVYYDGHYGPYTEGYWGPDSFYYRNGDGRYMRDTENHFRHERFEGGYGYQAREHENF